MGTVACLGKWGSKNTPGAAPSKNARRFPGGRFVQALTDIS
jgi:hypothetical protein